MTAEDTAALIAEARDLVRMDQEKCALYCPNIDRSIGPLVARLADALAAATQWRPIESAPRDGTRVLLCFKDDLTPYYGASEDRNHEISRWCGVMFVGMHDGYTSSGYDIGWRFRAPVGMGGLPDQWLAGWLPLPSAPADKEKA